MNELTQQTPLLPIQPLALPYIGPRVLGDQLLSGPRERRRLVPCSVDVFSAQDLAADVEALFEGRLGRLSFVVGHV